MNPTKKTHLFVLFSVLFAMLGACEFKTSDTASGTYVKPTITRKGHIRKGYIRKPYSTSKHAVRNRMKSRYYYHTRGKYRRMH
jgi:hypothetical protein